MADATDSLWWAAWADDIGAAALELRLAGGAQDGRRRPWPGLRERTAPTAERACFMPYALALRLPSASWSEGGELALDLTQPAQPEAPVLGRAWRLTRGQVLEYVRQILGDPEAVVPCEAILAGQPWRSPDGLVTVLSLPPIDGIGVLTATPALGGRGPLGPALLYHWVLGLVETYHLDQRGVRRYLQRLPWVADHYDGPTLNDLYRTVRDELGAG